MLSDSTTGGITGGGDPTGSSGTTTGGAGMGGTTGDREGS